VMEISRRALMGRAAFAAGLSILPTGMLANELLVNSVASRPAFVSAFSDQNDEHFIGVIDQYGNLLHRYSVSSRGHSACVSGDGKYVAFFARRPRRWLVIVDVLTGKLITETESISGRHFFGHGVFSRDGQYLYASENDYQNNRGVIGVYEVNNGFKRISEIPSFGIGPHELALLSDGKTLVVANGGIETHPDYGRRKLNLETMSPSLTYINLLSGKELSRLNPPHHHLSLRHLSVNQDDTVIVGAQYQGSPKDDQPLVFSSHISSKKLTPLIGQPRSNRQGLNRYIASVTFSNDGSSVLTSSPRGDVVSVWDVAKSVWLRDLRIPDVGGVSTYGSGSDMLLSSGNGKLYLFKPDDNKLSPLRSHELLRWDNHLVHL